MRQLPFLLAKPGAGAGGRAHSAIAAQLHEIRVFVIKQAQRAHPASAARLPAPAALPASCQPPTRRAAGLLLATLLLAAPVARAQRLLDFTYTDSLTQALLDQHRYRELDSVGRAARALGTAYPALQRRLGAAALARDQPATALGYYEPALRENPLDDLARTGLALAYQALGRPGPATLLARELPDSLRRALRLPGPAALASLEAEASVLATAEKRRGTAAFERLGLGSRLGRRFSLGQELSYYSQLVEQPRAGSPGVFEQHRISQVQYHALLTGQLGPRWQARVGYDFISPDQGPNHLGYLAFAYAAPRWTAQLGQYAGVLADSARTQTDLRLTVYPLGSLRFYAFGRGSLVGSGGRTYSNGTLGAGGRLHSWLWLEAWTGGGLVPVLAELDGTYVYNLLDPLRHRSAASLLILARRRWLLRLTYGAEGRYIRFGRANYTLHSFTATLTRSW